MLTDRSTGTGNLRERNNNNEWVTTHEGVTLDDIAAGRITPLSDEDRRRLNLPPTPIPPIMPPPVLPNPRPDPADQPSPVMPGQNIDKPVETQIPPRPADPPKIDDTIITKDGQDPNPTNEAPAPAPTPTLRSDYIQNPDGTVTGPRGGIYTPSPMKDENGNTLYTEAFTGSTPYTLDSRGATSLRTTTWQDSEQFIASQLGPTNITQHSVDSNGDETDYAADGSVRYDNLVPLEDGKFLNVEVKNYNIGNSSSELISRTGAQAIRQMERLPEGSIMEVKIDITGQYVSQEQINAITRGIVRASNGVVKAENIQFFTVPRNFR